MSRSNISVEDGAELARLQAGYWDLGRRILSATEAHEEARWTELDRERRGLTKSKRVSGS